MRALECCLCFQMRPKVLLRCSHGFCRDCIPSNYELNRKQQMEVNPKGKKPKFVCPICGAKCAWSNRGTQNNNFIDDTATAIISQFFIGTTLCNEDDNHRFLSKDIRCHTCDMDVCGLCYTMKHSDHECTYIVPVKQCTQEPFDIGDICDDVIFYDSNIPMVSMVSIAKRKQGQTRTFEQPSNRNRDSPRPPSLVRQVLCS